MPPRTSNRRAQINGQSSSPPRKQSLDYGSEPLEPPSHSGNTELEKESRWSKLEADIHASYKPLVDRQSTWKSWVVLIVLLLFSYKAVPVIEGYLSCGLEAQDNEQQEQFVPTKTWTQHDYANADYWDARYSSDFQDMEWYGTWNGDSSIRLKPLVSPNLPPRVKSVLDLGCGNSGLAEELANDGFRNVVGIDISQVVIDKMRKRNAGRQELSFLQMDATEMTFQNNTFDLAFDKGTLDAMYTAGDDHVKEAAREVFRVLKPGGVFISFTFGMTKTKDAGPWEYFHVLRVNDSGEGNKDGQPFYLMWMAKPKSKKSNKRRKSSTVVKASKPSKEKVVPS